MQHDLVAVIDVGKTHAKVLLVDATSGALQWSRQTGCTTCSVDGFRQLDVKALDDWLLATLAAAPGKAAIRDIVPVAHGAAAVLLDAQQAIVAAPDYEDAIYEVTDARYRAERDPFTQTFSPLLPQGLNLARQLHYLQQCRPDLHSRCTHLLLYPQYWAWRFCGVMASEVTSLGCHTDLWQPAAATFSPMAQRLGWSALLPPVRTASTRLGLLRPELVTRTGLPADCAVLCGIHDSNASYLCHLAGRPGQQPFAVIASGTWVIVMAQGGDLQRLQPQRDMLANVDARGHPVATARFMGGREYAAIAAASDDTAPQPTLDALRTVLHAQAMALPTFAPGTGPFPDNPGRFLNAAGLAGGARAALATLYVALMCELRLDDLGSEAEVIIDGPLAGNSLFGGLLATLSPRRVLLADRRAGTIRGALHLARPDLSLPDRQSETAGLDLPELRDYRARWRSLLPTAGTAEAAAPAR